MPAKKKLTNKVVDWLANAALHKTRKNVEKIRIIAPGIARSTCNAMLLSAIGFHCHFNQPNAVCSSHVHVIALQWFLGYLIHDTWKLLSHAQDRKVELIHHIASILIVHLMATKGFLNSHVPFMLLLEVSTIFLNVCKLFDAAGVTLENKAYLAFTVFFGLTFISIRVLWFGIRLYKADILHQDAEWLAMSGKWPVRLLFLLQVVWLKPLVDKSLDLISS